MIKEFKMAIVYLNRNISYEKANTPDAHTALPTTLLETEACLNETSQLVDLGHVSNVFIDSLWFLFSSVS